MYAFTAPSPIPTSNATANLHPSSCSRLLPSTTKPSTSTTRITPRRPAPHSSPRIRMGLFDMWSTPNDEPSSPAKLGFDVGYTYLAHPEKDTGEDAFFVEGTAIGVFDGVSGSYDTRGVDPRLYSQQLAAGTCERVKEYGAADVVKAAIEAAADNDQVGASTACVVGMDRVGRIFGINLGDSGVRLLRGGSMKFRTKEQQHFFNCPYQLGTDSEDGLAMGQNIQQKAQKGDILIIATDGLYDNVPDSDIISYANTINDTMQLAETLGDVASKRCLDSDFRSPFMMAAIQAGVKWKGGKPDDITVVVARVVEGATAKATSLLSTLPEVAGTA